MKSPMRKKVTSLGEGASDVREKVEHDTSTLNELNNKSQHLRLSLTHEDKRDKMQMKQPKHAPILKEGMVTQCTLRF